MPLTLRGAAEHNLRDITVTIPDGLTAVTGVSGSGKSSLVFDTLYHEAHRRLTELYRRGAITERPAPARVNRIEGLLPAIAVAQNTLNRNPASTVATATGIHPFLRLLFARVGSRICQGCGTPLTRATVDDVVRTISAGTIVAPLVCGLPGSHRTLLGLLAGEHERSRIVVDGSPYEGTPLDPDRPHDISLVVAQLGAPAEPRAVRSAVLEAAEVGSQIVEHRDKGLARRWALVDRCPACARWYRRIEPKRFREPCPACHGAGCDRCGGLGVHPDTLGVTVGGCTLSGVVSLDAHAAIAFFASLDLALHAKRLHDEIEKRLRALVALGLGYLTLDRPSPSLSRGEVQRLRLGVCLASRLEVLHVLDEPTIGLHARDTGTLFDALRSLAGPVVVVEHDPDAVSRADHCIDLGPGAGQYGGRVTYDGSPWGLWASETVTGRCFGAAGPTLPVGTTATVTDSHGVEPPCSSGNAPPQIAICGARAHNLAGIDVHVPIGRLTVVSGVSGSGKSSLVHGVLAASLQARRAVECKSIEAPPLACTLVDQNPIGRNPRSNPATYTKLADTIRDLFAASTGLSPSSFSFNRPEGACPTCKGIGALEVSMRYLPSSWIPCPDCEGRRFQPQTLKASIEVDGRQLSVADAFDLTVDETETLLSSDAAGALPVSAVRRARRIVAALQAIGLGYLRLGQPSTTLSGGEAQRVKLARYLGRRSLVGELLVLDEPSTGLHPANISDLVGGIATLVDAGTTVVVVEHNLEVIRAADWVIDLGPGAGPHGGTLVYEGPLTGLVDCSSSETGDALRAGVPTPAAPGGASRPGHLAIEHARDPAHAAGIVVRDAAANNLRGVTVTIPHRALTVVTGLSGSGKSSLVRDVIESEARRRFLETLSLYERQSSHEHDHNGTASIEGLGVAVAVDPARLRYSVRSTLGGVTEITPRLAVLLAASDERACPSCGDAMNRVQAWTCPGCGLRAPLFVPEDFLRSTYRAACRQCNGVGSLTRPNPEKLIVRPDRPLCGGAMHSPGFFPKGYLCSPGNGGYDVVQAFSKRYSFDPATTLWNEMSAEARDRFLFGDPDPFPVVFRSRNGRAQTRTVRFAGFYGWIADWDVGGTYTDRVPCEACGGSGLRPESRSVKLNGRSMGELARMPLAALSGHLDGWRPPRTTRVPRTADVQSAHETILSRLAFLVRSGLGYLTLDRTEGTLSAGEAQRSRLAGLLGSGLTGLTVLLDEPSRGLHASEVDELVRVVGDLRDEGNTVIVVEHEPAFVEAADTVVEMGPGAGSDGGRVVFAGPPAGLVDVAGSPTAAWLRRTAAPRQRPKRRPAAGWCTLVGARENNLRGIDARFPLGTLTGVCGVSGSGKSTLVVDTLARILAPAKHTTSVAYEPIEPGAHERVEGAPARTIVVDQARSGLGNPARFLGLDRPLAALYAAAPDALDRGLTAADLGRLCDACDGSGRIRHDMGFLPAVYARCETCDGTGIPNEFHDLTCAGIALGTLRGMTIADIARAVGDEAAVTRAIAPAINLGLGYLVAYQPPETLSGGEAQRLKIAKELRRPHAECYILDEPTVGQHRADVARLAEVLHRLTDTGRTVIVVEHHADLLAACDWLIELGPGAGPDGGRIIAEGTPERIAAMDTPTAPCLAAALGGR